MNHYFENASYKKKRIEIFHYLSENEFKHDMIGMLGSGLPLRYFDNNIIKKYLDPITDAVIGTACNSKNIKKILTETHDQYVLYISEKLKNKKFNLQMDGATVNNLQFMSINTHIFEEGNKLVINLGIFQIKGRCTSSNLFYHLQEVLMKFQLTTDNITTITCDNAPNFIGIMYECRMKKNEKLKHELEESDEETEIEIKKLDIYDVCDMFGPLIQNQSFKEKNIGVVRCGLHTLQLALRDSLKNNLYFIDQIRNKVKYLRNPINRSELESRNLIIPPIDIITRWNSTFNMVSAFFRLKEFIKEKGAEDSLLVVTDNEWKKIYEFIEAYKLSSLFTTKMQAPSVTLAEFEMEWNFLEEETKALTQNIFTDNIIDALLTR